MTIAVWFVLMITGTVTGNLLMKIGANATPSPLLLNLVSWKTVAGIAAFGLAGVIYAWVLKYLPLNVANSLAAAQFVSVIITSAVVLSEPIPAPRWIGIGLIVAGILVVGLTVNPGPTTPGNGTFLNGGAESAPSISRSPK